MNRQTVKRWMSQYAQKKGYEVVVDTLPKCSFCSSAAHYDAAMRAGGPWAFMCEEHFDTFGWGFLGTGYGQRLVVEKGNG